MSLSNRSKGKAARAFLSVRFPANRDPIARSKEATAAAVPIAAPTRRSCAPGSGRLEETPHSTGFAHARDEPYGATTSDACASVARSCLPRRSLGDLSGEALGLVDLVSVAARYRARPLAAAGDFVCRRPNPRLAGAAGHRRPRHQPCFFPPKRPPFYPYPSIAANFTRIRPTSPASLRRL